MKGMVLAAGIGSRLGEITKSTPKCLVQVGEKALLEYAIEKLIAAGISSVVINLHHHAEQVRSFVRERNNFGISVTFSYEPELLDTGGAVWNARELLGIDEPILVYNSDVYCDLNLTELISFFEQKKPHAALVIQKRETSRYLIFNDEKQLIGRYDTKGGEQVVRESVVRDLFAFSGIQIISPEMYTFMEPLQPKFSSITAYIEAAKAGSKIIGYLLEDAYWLDVGTPERLELLKARLGQG